MLQSYPIQLSLGNSACGWNTFYYRTVSETLSFVLVSDRASSAYSNSSAIILMKVAASEPQTLFNTINQDLVDLFSKSGTITFQELYSSSVLSKLVSLYYGAKGTLDDAWDIDEMLQRPSTVPLLGFRAIEQVYPGSVLFAFNL
jgi:hypothetical protein